MERVILRCGNPSCGMNHHQHILKGGPQRLGDASFFTGSIRCRRPHCKCDNEFVVIDGEVVFHETITPAGQVVYSLEVERGKFDLIKPVDKDTPAE